MRSAQAEAERIGPKLSEMGRSCNLTADILNDRVLPYFEEHGIPLCRVLTDRGTEYCGKPERHEYELYLAVPRGTCAGQHRAIVAE